MQEQVTFMSAGLKLTGILHVPDDMKPNQARPAVAVLHGFGGNKNGGIPEVSAKLFEKLGYVTLRFDMRGCGNSEGVRGRVICLEQVEDTKAAVSFLATRKEVRPERIAVMGFSFGAAVAVYAAGVDKRIAACISVGGWGDGEKKFRRQHESPAAWKKFSDMMAEGRRQLAQGTSITVPRFDIVPIQPGLRTNLAPGSILEFPFEVVESMFAFRANDVVGKIAPRPLLLLHPSVDTVTPTEQSIDLFAHAGQPTDLHLVAQTDHFMLAENNALVHALLRGWLDKHFPPAPGR
jgi:alpha/beta superfamily hydrolase